MPVSIIRSKVMSISGEELGLQALKHRPEHEHLLLVALDDLAGGGAAALVVLEHQEQVGVVGLA